MKTIFTYHQNLPGWNHAEMVGIWKRNWKCHGFKAMVMGRDAAKRHPMFVEFVKKTRTFPTINDRAYEEACYIRWLALDVMLDVVPGNRALMSDYDVFNQCFGDEHFGTENVICHELTKVPCLVEANKKGAKEIIEFIMSREPKENHYSDMIAFKESDWPVTQYCLEMGEKRGKTPWKKAPAVHVASGAVHREVGRVDKLKYIRKHWR